MKKILLSLLLIATTQAQPKSALPDLQETVRQRSQQANNAYSAAHVELCKAEALANLVKEQAENTRLFLQDFNFCEYDSQKNKKGKPTDKAVAEINKKIIPSILAESRSIDRLQRTIKQLQTKIDKDRGTLRRNYSHEEKKLDKQAKDKTSKIMISLGKAFRSSLDSAKSSYQELMAIQLRLMALREKLLVIENPFIKQQQDLAQKQLTALPAAKTADAPAPTKPAEKDNSWSITSWIDSIFGSKEAEEESKAQKNKAQYLKIKQKRENATAKLKNIKRHKPKPIQRIEAPVAAPQKQLPANDNLAFAGDLEMQIKLLGESIQKLSANIDAQLQDLEILTRSMAQETLSKVDL